jgi:hypothetical protein
MKITLGRQWWPTPAKAGSIVAPDRAEIP